jgi:hypothetical protein
MKEKVAHLIVRVPKAGKQLAAMIAQHEVIAAKHGFVWFGVQGQRMSPERVSLLLEQIKQDTPTYLYVVQRLGAGFAAFRAKIMTITETLSKSEWNHVPDYYEDDFVQRGARGGWVRVEHFEEIEERVLDSISIYSNEAPLVHVLKNGMSSVMLVTGG